MYDFKISRNLSISLFWSFILLAQYKTLFGNFSVILKIFISVLFAIYSDKDFGTIDHIFVFDKKYAT